MMAKNTTFSPWTGDGESFSPKYVKTPTKAFKKSVFTKDHVQSENESPVKNKDFYEKRPKYSNKNITNLARRYSSENEHTVIDILEDNPSTKHYTSHNRNLTKREKSLETETESGDEPDGYKTSDESEGNAQAEEGSETSLGKTTSALLLADEQEDVLGNSRDGNLWNVLAFKEPEAQTKEELEKWSKLTYYPSSNAVPDSDKFVKDVEARITEDEGIFAGEPVKSSKGNMNKLERRLVMEDAMEWFGSDGKLLTLPDSYRAEVVQLCIEDNEKQLEFDRMVVFAPARLHQLEDFKIDPNQGCEIEMDFGYVNFAHHPFFSKEHVIAACLEKEFEEYYQRRLNKATERAINKLKALRESVDYTKETIDSIKEDLDNENDSGKIQEIKESLDQHQKRLLGYRKEMKRCTLARDRGYWDDKSSINAVLEAWKDLKNIREDQGYTNTSIKLNIMELPGDRKDEHETWVKEIEEDLRDIEEENKEIYQLEMAKFRGKMKKWNETKRKGKKGKIAKDSEEEEADEDGSISRRPKPPDKPDIEGIKKALEKRYREIRKLPGDPNIVVDIVRTLSITQNNQLPEDSDKEKKRRKALKSSKVEIHLWFNGKEIYVSKPRDIIGSNFSAFLGFKVPISITEWPELLEIQVIETGTKMKTNMISIPFPHSKTTIERCQMQKLKFSSEDVIKSAHEGVGSGTAFEILGRKYDALDSNGTITLRCGWTTDKDGKVLCPKGLQDSNEQDPQTDESYRRKLSDSSQLDPNDPRNITSKIKATVEDGMSQFDRKDSEGKQMENEFQAIDERMDEFEFCLMERIDKSARFRVLKLRDQSIPEFRNIKMVPLNDRDVSGEMFQAYEKRLKEDKRKRAGDNKSLVKFGRKKLMDDDFVYESNRLEKIREIRISVLQLFEKSLRQITFEDLVIEEQIPDIGTLGLNLMQFFQPRRPLRPIRKERKRIQASNLVDTKIGLIANIVRAFNLPFRKDTDAGLLTTESVTGIQLAKKRLERTPGNYSTVRPFVEIWFQRNVARTTTALGSNPTWNQELELNLSVPNDDYSQSNLSKMDDLIYLLLYDEVAVDMLEDERRRETDIYQRLEKRWLGSITIPFSTLYTNGRIEGTFKLNTPHILLGYEAQGMTTHFGGVIPNPGSNSFHNNSKDQSSRSLKNQKSAFMTIFITLQPAVQPLLTSKEATSATGETTDMMAFIKTWKNSFEKRFSDRLLRPLVMTAEGDTVLCTRYLKPIQPPEIFLNSEVEILHVMEELSHYVSLFPSVRDSTLGITDYSLWFTSDVFIMTPGGGIEDHAVLLACFFTYLNIPCWIIQGNAIPDGPTSFVLTSFKGVAEDKGVHKSLKNALLIWNPNKGEYFSTNDSFCPLQKVWAVVGKQNIWANSAEGDRPYQLEWDIGKSNFWLPLFLKPISEEKIPCIQTGQIKYKTSDQNQANSLAQRIERHLKETFMKWRKTSKTNWNRYCSATLRKLLPKLEENKSGRSRIGEIPESGSIESVLSLRSGSITSINEEHLTELREITTSYQMTGFPLQQPYINMELITETVFATGVHTIDTPDVEFALAAYAHSYPASVYSVWIYVAALHRRK